MSIADWTGFAGVSMILLAYFLNAKNILTYENPSYFVLNLVGAVLACISAYIQNSIPFVILEGVWAIVSLQSLWKLWRKA